MDCDCVSELWTGSVQNACTFADCPWTRFQQWLMITAVKTSTKQSQNPKWSQRTPTVACTWSPDHGQESPGNDEDAEDDDQRKSGDMTVLLTVICLILLMPIAGLGWWVSKGEKEYFVVQIYILGSTRVFCFGLAKGENSGDEGRRALHLNGCCWSLVNLFADNELALLSLDVH